MKRSNVIYVLLLALVLSFVACGQESAETTIEEIDNDLPQTTEAQVAVDLVSDYTALGTKELEVLSYEGDVQAQYQLGVTYEYGTESTEQNLSKALEWYEIAAEQEYKDALNAVGYFYLNGVEVAQDLDLAYEYFDRADQAGCKNSKVGKARVILAKEDEELYEEAYSYIRAAYSTGDIDAIYYMGYMSENGLVVEQSYDKALYYYQILADTTDYDIQYAYSVDSALVRLGLMYMNGMGVDVDQELAYTYFEKASEHGHAKAYYYIGQIYENGLGVDVDYEKAIEYYQLACDQEYAPALSQMGYLYYRGLGVDVDFASNVYYQKLAALQGYPPAQVNLGYLYENGYGVERNLQTACSYYEMAADAGYEGASEAVVRVRAQMNEEN